MLTTIAQLYKQAYSGLSRNSWYLSVVMFINRSGTMVVPFLSIYCVQELHFSIVQAGTIMAMFGIGSIMGSFFGGKLTDKIGFYDLQVGALLSGGLLFMLLGFLRTYPTLAIGTFILSFCNESFRPANSTAIAHYSSEDNKIRSYSLNRLAVNLGWAFGAATGGLLAAVNYHLLFWVDGCTNILAGVMLLILMPRSKVMFGIKKHVDEANEAISAYKDKVYLAFIFLSTLFGMCFFQFFIMQPVFLKLNWHLGERIIGALMAWNGVMIALIEMIIVHRLEGRRNGLVYIITGVLTGAVGYILFNLLPAGIAAAAVIVTLITLSEILAMPFMNAFWISRCSPTNRGEYAALYSMSWSAAQVTAPFLGSVLIQYGGFYLLWWMLGLISLFAATGYWFLYRYIKTPLTS
ncbi:MFS transporter [Mucilaginibacter auburnensis]|uniref:Putative MFS family arabinose efflux permease n=1 Tax=Mucilaginibacter auburnensis TaxID=1457233 RepID=A0A2H9VLT9_9SPHI|nr:MFS transporter [Mucilaginibacter auburnensis]PJJ79307.1 putative MFS family arabinose efflux permease [Mucilaginibacter auburnensis]